MCQFGIPHVIIIDNEPQFDSNVFQTFCSELSIWNFYSMPRHPQINKQVEATYKTLLNSLKKQLERAKGKWVDKLPGMLWLIELLTIGLLGSSHLFWHMAWRSSFQLR